MGLYIKILHPEDLRAGRSDTLQAREHGCGEGAVFAASNAALMLAELEEAPGAAVREMQRVARRAPGSADMRAALAALYWAQARTAYLCCCSLGLSELVEHIQGRHMA